MVAGLVDSTCSPPGWANKTVRYFWYGHHYIKMENDYDPQVEVDQSISMVIVIIIIMIRSNFALSSREKEKKDILHLFKFSM